MFFLMRLFRSVLGYFLGAFQGDGMENAAVVEECRGDGPSCRPKSPTHAVTINDRPGDGSDATNGELVQVVIGGKPLRKFLSWDNLHMIMQLVTRIPLDVEAIKECINNQPESLCYVDEKGGNTVLHRLTESLEEHDDKISKSHGELLKFVLDQKKIDVNSVNISQNTPLHIAAKNNKYKTIKMLLQSEANINAKNNDGDTCLHVAVKHGSVEAVAKLHCYADDHLDEELTNKQGFTALNLAQQILYNEDRTTMGKICDILNKPAVEFRDEKIDEDYLLKESEDADWSLKPMIVHKINVEEGGNAVIGNNTFHFPTAKAAASFAVEFKGIGDATLAIKAQEEEVLPIK